ncbi:MAG: PAS domain-containing protein, partial [Comamonadaceae bacterium]
MRLRSVPVIQPSGDLPDLAALAAWAPALAKTFASLSSDIALVIDPSGVIRTVAQGAGDPLAPMVSGWVGRHWADTVSGETRGKIEHLLHEVTTTGIARRREVNHPLQQGAHIPVAYSAIRFGVNGPVLAVGQDLRAIVAIQQRFLESQQEMERGYWRARQVETRYRLLFQVATDAVMVVDGHTLRVLEANQAAARMFDMTGESDRALNVYKA